MIRQPDPERQGELWHEFVDAYSATRTRPAVDLFLAGLFGTPSDRGYYQPASP